MDPINNAVTYLFGENAALDGEVNGEWILDTFYYKNTPIITDFFAKIRELFWNFIRNIIDLFN